MSQHFEAVVIGAGPGGEVAASRLSRQGLRTALIERELVGGECAYWACIPSKTLLRPAEVRAEASRTAGTSEPEQRWSEIAEYRDYMIRHLDDAEQVAAYRDDGVSVFKGDGRIVAEHTIVVAGETLQADRIVIATGSDPLIPAIPGLEQAGYWTNREATTLAEVPDSVVVLGGGPVGVELGQFMRRFGSNVTLVESGPRLLAREDPRVSELLADALAADGIDVRLGSAAASVASANGKRAITLDDGATVSGHELVVAVGRAPRVAGVGIEALGVEPGPKGIAVDERCRVTDGVWAIGDVTGAMLFTHVAKYQGRIACDDIAGRPVRADYAAVPRVVFSDPEIAAVGLTEEQASQRQLDVATARIELAAAISRPWTYERDPRGELGLLADRKRRVLVGAWAVAPLAGEWIHYAALAIKAQIPLEVLTDTVAQFPTYTEAFLQAIEQLEL